MGGMRFISTAVRTICGVGISYGVSVACIRIVKCAEGTEWELGRRDRIFLIISSFAFSLLTVMLPGMDIVSEMLSEILVGALLFACVTDVKSCEVYQFTWWIAGVADVLMWIYEGGPVISVSGLAFLCFLLLQECVFSRCYGRADCHAYVVCAAVGCVLGMDLPWYFLHMVIAFLLLTVVQAFRRNIGRRGSLKRSVAFIPYITVSFWILISLFSVLEFMKL